MPRSYTKRKAPSPSTRSRQIARDSRPYIALRRPRADFLAVLESAKQALEDAALGIDGSPKKLGRPKTVRS